MALEERGAQQDKIPGDKYVNPNADYEMSTYDYIVRPSADAASGPISVTLPRVTEARGRFYSIVCRNADGVNTVTLQDRDDSECWLADIVFDGKCDKMLMYSDGLCWHPLGAGGPGGWPGFDTTAGPGTTEPPTTAAPTTAAPTTAAGQSTAAPTTAGATTAAPTTAAPTSAAPTTAAPTTASDIRLKSEIRYL